MNLEQALARIAELEAELKAERVHLKDETLKVKGIALNLLNDDVIPMITTARKAIAKGHSYHADNYLDRLLMTCQAKLSTFNQGSKSCRD